jgi:hypothetical protein
MFLLVVEQANHPLPSNLPPNRHLESLAPPMKQL